MKNETILYWSEEDGAYIAEVPELAGCMADGATPDDLADIQRARAEYASGQTVPHNAINWG